MEIIPLKTKIIKPGQNLADLFFNLFKKHKLRNKDIIVISSKIVAVSQGRIIELKKVKPKNQAKTLAKKHNLSPAFCQLVINEADEILGGVKKAILTINNGFPIANAGIDQSNVKLGFAALWPKNPHIYLDKLKRALESRFKAKIGLIIADSHCTPLRMGTSGLALSIAGFEGIGDERGHQDIYGRKLLITRTALADQLSSAAQSVMGEANKKIPVAIIRDAEVTLSNKSARVLSKKLLIRKKACLFRDYRVK